MAVRVEWVVGNQKFYWGDFLLGEGYEIKTKMVGGGRMSKFLAGGGSNHPTVPQVGKTLISTLV